MVLDICSKIPIYPIFYLLRGTKNPKRVASPSEASRNGVCLQGSVSLSVMVQHTIIIYFAIPARFRISGLPFRVRSPYSGWAASL